MAGEHPMRRPLSLGTFPLLRSLELLAGGGARIELQALVASPNVNLYFAASAGKGERAQW